MIILRFLILILCYSQPLATAGMCNTPGNHVVTLACLTAGAPAEPKTMPRNLTGKKQHWKAALFYLAFFLVILGFLLLFLHLFTVLFPAWPYMIRGVLAGIFGYTTCMVLLHLLNKTGRNKRRKNKK